MVVKEHLKWSVRFFILGLGLFIACLFLNRLLQPFYTRFLKRDLAIEIVATAQQSEEAVWNNVRLTGINADGVDLDLGAVKTGDGWQYHSHDGFLFAYDNTTPVSLELELNNVDTVKFQFVKEVGSGIVTVIINNEVWKTIDLYSAEEWQEEAYTYYVSSILFPERDKILMVFLAVFCYIVTALLFIICKKTVRMRIYYRMKEILFQSFGAFLCVINVYIIQYQRLDCIETILVSQTEVVLKTLLFVFLLIRVFYFLFGKTWMALLAVPLGLEVLSCINVIKEGIRGVPLLPSDLRNIGTAISVASRYGRFIDSLIFLVILLTVIQALLIRLLNYYNFERNKVERVFSGVLSTSLLAIFLVYGIVFARSLESSDAYRVYQPAEYYEKYGFIYSFNRFLSYLKPVSEPDNYSAGEMRTIKNMISQSDNNTETEKIILPNIIIVMSESFWDITDLETVTFDLDPLPSFHALEKESTSGDLLSHVFGGGTAISEFECLTGFNGTFLDEDYMVYGSSLSEGFGSVVSFLKDMGYQTAAFHPYTRSNYNREDGYQRLGFDEYSFEDSFDPSAEKVRGYISDQMLFQKMIDEYENMQKKGATPAFMFAVTMQNHGGYWSENIYNGGEVSFSAPAYTEETLLSMQDYFTGLHESDKALGMLTDYFRTVDAETIIVYYGDHKSDAGPNNDMMLQTAAEGKGQLEADLFLHTVPYIIWDNKRQLLEDTNTIMDISLLLPTITDALHWDQPTLWRFLVDLSNHYTAANHSLYISPSNEYRSLSEMSEEERQWREAYECIQYDYMFGDRYLEDLWEVEG